MKLLLDTHLLLWTAQKSTRLSAAALKLINDPANELLFSVASLWEFGIKYAKVPDDFGVSPSELREALLQNGFVEVEITGKHVLAISNLPALHGDPFDRLLVAQTAVEGITLLTSDARVAQYPGSIRKV
ncbi:type II toxin-antitoxin system VapC family toxin [Acidobacteria bacterium AB60]|nr:type II toxin-antitoxin system VapC family toxin [Acidobacteria bacterium AB60]